MPDQSVYREAQLRPVIEYVHTWSEHWDLYALPGNFPILAAHELARMPGFRPKCPSCRTPASITLGSTLGGWREERA